MKDVIDVDHVSCFCAARAAQMFLPEQETLAIYIHLGYKDEGLFRRRGYTLYAVGPVCCIPLGSYERSELGWKCVKRPADLTDPMEQVIKANLDHWHQVADRGYHMSGVV